MGPPDPDRPPPSSHPSPRGWRPPAVADLDALIPGRYEVLQLLGAGGMAAVYKARQTALNRLVAIKILPPESTGEGDAFHFTERFKLEARAMANLNHPCIVAVHDFGQTTSGLFYFVMEYVDGMDIVGYLREHGGKLPEKYALTITAHVLDALACAHDHGIIHRDIKPANILINSEGQVKIADFGLAKHSATPASAGLTRTNMAMGTPDFVSPEALASDAPVDARADLYAVGVMLYQMLTGEIPRGRFQNVCARVPGLDERIDPIIDKAMEADPASRYQSASAMRAALDTLFSAPLARVEPGSPSTAIPVKPKKMTPPPGAAIVSDRSNKKTPLEIRRSLPPALVAASVAAGTALLALLAWHLFKPATRDQSEADLQSAVPQSGADLQSAVTSPPAPPPSKPKPKPAAPATPPTPPEEVATKPEGPDSAGPPPPAPVISKSPEPPTLPEPSPTTPSEPSPTRNEGRDNGTTAAPPPSLPGVAEFKTHWTNYEQVKARQFKERVSKYLSAINTAGAAAIEAGDTALAVALRDEKARVEKDGAVPAETDTDIPTQLSGLRREFHAGIEQSEAGLLAKSLEYLADLESALTRQKRLDDAIAVKTWRESLAPAQPAPTESVATTSPTRNEPTKERDNGDEVAKNPFGWKPLPENPFPLPRPVRPTTSCRVVAWRLDGKPVDEAEFTEVFEGLPSELGEVVDLVARSSAAASFPIPLALGSDGGIRVLRRTYGKFIPSDLSNVVEVAGGPELAAAIRSDGTVVPIPLVSSTRTEKDLYVSGTASWKNIVAVRTGLYHILALTARGDLLTAGRNANKQCEIPQGFDRGIVQIGGAHTISWAAKRETDGWHIRRFGRDPWSRSDPIDPEDRVLLDANLCVTDGRGRIRFTNFLNRSYSADPDHLRGSTRDVREIQFATSEASEIGAATLREGEDQWRFWGDLGDICKLDPDYCETKAAGCWKVFLIGPYALALKPLANLKPDDWTGGTNAEFGMRNAEPETKSAAPANTALSPAAATKDKPFENSLGMRFVPVPITGGPTGGQRVLFSVWETRVKDYAAFIKKDRKREWPEPDFKQGDDHPAVNVSWDDAAAFCAWLTQEDQKNGLLGKDERYRLPTDHEWSCAVGIGPKEDPSATPIGKNRKLTGIYPWGKEWPPPKGAGNYYGEEAKRNPIDGSKIIIEGYDDGYDRTAPVGSFEANPFGLYDLGGNACEWCEDWNDPARKHSRVLRGSSLNYAAEANIRASNRYAYAPDSRYDSTGFRLVLGGGGGHD